MSGTSLGLFPTSYWTCVAAFQALRALRLAWLPLASARDVDAMAGALWKLPELHDLDLAHSQFINGATLRVILASCGPQLRRLALGTVPPYSLAATQMALELARDEDGRADGALVDDGTPGRARAPPLPQLTELTLGDAHALKLAAILLAAAGGPHPTLRALRLRPGLARGPIAVRDLGALLRCLPRLRVLDLPECGACDARDLRQLATLRELERLTLRNYRAGGAGIVERGCAHAAPRLPDLSGGLAALRELTLRGWSVSLSELAALPQLASLALENCEVVGGAARAASASVHTLTIKLTGEASAPLPLLAASFPKVRVLTVQRSQPGCHPVGTHLSALFPELCCLKLETCVGG